MQINRSNSPQPITFYGNITASGDISASGTLSLGEGANFIGGKRFITSTDGFEFRDGTLKAIGGIIGKHITASGDISASGLISTNTLSIASTADGGATIGNDQILHAGIEASAPDLTVGQATTATNITAVATTDNAEFFVGVLDGASGAQVVETSTKLKYNPNSGKLTANGDISASGTVFADKLHLKASTTPGPIIQLENDSGGSGADSFIRFGDSGENYSYALGVDDSSNTFRLAYNGSSFDGAVLGTNDRITIDTSGNVGIGTTSPTAKFHVEGDISSSGDIKALTFTSPTLDITDGSAQMTADKPLTFGTLVSTDLGRLNIEHDDSDGSITNNRGLLTILNTGGGGIKFGSTTSHHITSSGGAKITGELTVVNGNIRSNNNFDFLQLGGSAQQINVGKFGMSASYSGVNTAISNMATSNAAVFGGDVSVGPHSNGSLGIGTLTPGEKLEVVGNISASGTITGLTGSFSALVGDTSQGTSLEVEGPITGSAFRGTKHILRNETIYINDNPFVQNSVYFGNSLGNQPNNWNDPQAAGGAITSTNTISIAEDDMNWGYILPFDISKVEVQCSLRPALGNGDDFTLAIYTADRQNDAASANMTITKVANSSGVTFSAAKYVTNDLTYTADLDKGSLIFVGVGSEDATDAKNARGLLNITVTAR